MHDGVTGAVNMIRLGDRGPVQIADVRLLPAARSVEGPAGGIQTEPRIMQLLLALADSGNEVAPRERLLLAGWGEVVVGDDALNRAVAGARRALADCGSQAVAIRTIPRIGYRLETAMPPAHGAPPALSGSRPEPPPRGLSRRRLMAGGAALAAMGGVAGGGWLYGRHQRHRRMIDTPLQAARAELLAEQYGFDSRARGLLEQALAQQPQSAAAWGLLAIAGWHTAANAAVENLAASRHASTEAASRALALDRRQGDALAARALLEPFYGEWWAAEQRIDNALAIAPDNIFIMAGHMRLLMAVGRLHEAGAVSARLLALAPGSNQAQMMRPFLLWAADEQQRGLALAEQAIAARPQAPGVQFARLWLLAANGRADQAAAIVRTMQEKQQSPSRVLTSWRHTMQAIAHPAPALVDQAARALTELAAITGGMLGTCLMGLGAIGRTEAALALAERAYASPDQLAGSDMQRLVWRYERDTWWLFMPPLAPLHDEPRFAQLGRRIGLARYWQESGARADFLRRRLLPA